ncbi:MAG: VWA domain-containing protein [Eubacterium sp.]|nr:VWA domain-containing protein [Eubacterium sp.]
MSENGFDDWEDAVPRKGRKRKKSKGDSFDSGFDSGFDELNDDTQSEDEDKSKDYKFNLALFLLTTIVGYPAYILCVRTFNALHDVVPHVLLIPLVFMMLVLIVLATVMLTNLIFRNNDEEVIFYSYPKFFILLFISLILLFGLTALFQYLYSIERSKKVDETTSVIFAIDDSSSMSYQDPTNERYRALNEVVHQFPKKFPYMVYKFSEYPRRVRDMGPFIDNDEIIAEEPEGGTSIKMTLETILDDYKNGVWSGGNHPQVVLLTDGDPTDFDKISDINDLLKEFNDNNISVSVVGLGLDNQNLMNGITSRTGGNYVHIENVSDLYDALGKASKITKYVRHLYGYRPYCDNYILLGIFRVFALTVMGSLMGVLVSFSCFYRKTVKFTILVSAIQALVGAIAMELGYQVFNAAALPFLLLWILFASTVAIKPDKKYLSGYKNSSHKTGEEGDDGFGKIYM